MGNSSSRGGKLSNKDKHEIEQFVDEILKNKYNIKGGWDLPSLFSIKLKKDITDNRTLLVSELELFGTYSIQQLLKLTNFDKDAKETIISIYDKLNTSLQLKFTINCTQQILNLVKEVKTKNKDGSIVITKNDINIQFIKIFEQITGKRFDIV